MKESCRTIFRLITYRQLFPVNRTANNKCFVVTKRHYSTRERIDTCSRRGYASEACSLSLKDVNVQNYIQKLASSSNQISEGHNYNSSAVISRIVKEIFVKQNELEELKTLSEDPDFREIAAKDALKINEELENLGEEFFKSVLEPEPLDHNDVVIEVSAGIGGQEAMLFAQELFQMYQYFASFHGLEVSVTKYDETEIGGIRQGFATISGIGAYRIFKFEGGVHRVQRTPKTEKSGRIHTSTATVAVIPLPTEIQVVLAPQDLKYEPKKASGAGGQHVNTTESAIRLTHLPTGLSVECQMERSQIRNRTLALQMLRAKIYEKELQSQNSKMKQTRKLQTGLAGRSEKIRTYNFVQDRVTDHRIGISVFNLRGILDGTEYLNDLVEKLHEYDNQERILQLFTEAS
ncbi:unnamed protein product [Allacma fusca]|uniref:Peptide chain release factor domain-containing protein n=1 Tax=Allacma fusca TaxID=39272 RepID=A0A8J2Q5U3_9HEXA|nr:unnamed protein product [Allacma fusca]